MIEYNKMNVKLSDLQLNKLKAAVGYKTGVTLKMNTKMFNGKIYLMNFNSKTNN